MPPQPIAVISQNREMRNNYQMPQQHEGEEEGLSQLPQGIQHKHNNLQYLAVLAFALIIGAILIFKVFTSYDRDIQNGRFYLEHVRSLELIDFWKMSQQKMQEEQANATHNIIDKSEHQISRQQLGHQSWSLLHMITGAFPETFDDNLRQKFNTFLILFGQMYPCKMCANHFMGLLKEEGLFRGNSKKQLMEYLCMIHNRVNKRLGHPIHDCSNVVEEWNTCGCSGQPNA